MSEQCAYECPFTEDAHPDMAGHSYEATRSTPEPEWECCNNRSCHNVIRREVDAARSTPEPGLREALDSVRAKWIADIAIEYPIGDGTTLDPAVDEALHYAAACLDDTLAAASSTPEPGIDAAWNAVRGYIWPFVADEQIRRNIEQNIAAARLASKDREEQG